METDTDGCFYISYYAPPSLRVSLQDSSSGNASDMESQEGGGGHGHKSKGKEGSRQSASHKAAAGYKVEDKST